ncbi:hypothetical protein M440DRAFT_1396039 [Trichoderma longibrachiatum ATCC 18648]|uniref:Uncharacterized protein n=1 Tax=Trichoderma longibrachiatum ATCC 18648 TaxID=983965 RepID=A0A2T4CH43_TRILO|nr:hypothetical protein M440DRAFT_1396039 [Trichoderma longibrachiatum ATCC 18648]
MTLGCPSQLLSITQVFHTPVVSLSTPRAWAARISNFAEGSLEGREKEESRSQREWASRKEEKPLDRLTVLAPAPKSPGRRSA